MKIPLSFFLAFTFLFAVHADKPKVEYKTIAHNARQVLIRGLSEKDVIDIYGKPNDVISPPKIVKTNHPLPKELQSNYQWSYPLEMGHRVIWFKDGQVVYCLEEWSDW